MCQPACTPRLYSVSIIYSIALPLSSRSVVSLLLPSYLFLHALSHTQAGRGRKKMAMAPVLLHALLLASAAAAVAMVDNNATTGDGSSNTTTTTSRVMCNGGAECEPPGNPLPIYGYPPPAVPSLPSAPPTPPSSSSPGSQMPPCPPAAVVCCGGAGTAQQPPTGGYVPYYNASAASPPALLLAPITCIFLQWLLV